MKIYSCVVTIAVNDEGDNPVRWNWVELMGNGVQNLDVYDVTEHDVERVRLTATGVEEV